MDESSELTTKRIRKRRAVDTSSSHQVTHVKQLKLEEQPQVESVILPTNYKMNRFLEARKDEIFDLNRRIAQKLPKLASQRIARHMRRRQVAHNKRRLPTRLRHLAPDDPQKKKTPSRRHRRRPKNLLQAYQRRQRQHVWLETHIWHAKRFRMQNIWGYRLPISSFEKSIRASFRGVSTYCLLNDISFWCCVELCGTFEVLTERLSNLCSPKIGLTFKARAFADGAAEGSVVLYRKQQYPLGCLGPVRFLWRPSAREERQLWIWVHPSMHQAIIEELKDLFGLTAVSQTGLKPDTAFENAELKVKMNLLKDTLNRFRLTGPLADLVLSNALHVPENEIENSSKMASWCNKRDIKIMTEHFYAFWRNFKNASSSDNFNFKLNAVIGGLVNDPRFHLPNTRQPISSLLDSESGQTKTSATITDFQIPINSPIWRKDIRDDVTSNMISETRINLFRLNTFAASCPSENLDCETKIPILLIKRQGCRQTNVGYGSGWDLILPSDWGRPFWISLVYRGARASGLRELAMIDRSCGRPFFPDDYPDSEAGAVFEKSDCEAHREKHLRYPPAKRPSFVKLGIPSPYSFPWHRLLKEWCEVRNKGSSVSQTHLDSDPLYVLRDRKALMVLKQLLETTTLSQSTNIPEFEEHCRHAILFVRLECIGKGIPVRFGQICLPTVDDIKMFRAEPMTYPVAKMHAVPRPFRKLIAPCIPTIIGVKSSSNNIPTSKEAPELCARRKVKFAKNRSKLVKETSVSFETQSLVKHNDRLLMGFVTSGFRGYARQKSTGQGYIAVSSFLQWIGFLQTHRLKPVVLFRSQNSLQYRYANLSLGEM